MSISSTILLRKISTTEVSQVQMHQVQATPCLLRLFRTPQRRIIEHVFLIPTTTAAGRKSRPVVATFHPKPHSSQHTAYPLSKSHPPPPNARTKAEPSGPTHPTRQHGRSRVTPCKVTGTVLAHLLQKADKEKAGCKPLRKTAQSWPH